MQLILELGDLLAPVVPNATKRRLGLETLVTSVRAQSCFLHLLLVVIFLVKS
jgi:hypothetical protein